MGIVLRFPHHARASSEILAAKYASRSAVKPADEARPVPSTDAHHSAGMLFRCHHLETFQDVAPGKSAAIASREGQSSITPRKDDKSSDIALVIGPSVLKRKAVLSLDVKKSLGHNVRMADSEAEQQYKQEFRARVAEARTARNLKQWEMAEALDVPQDQYKQYETRGLLPHRFIWRFCMFARVNPEWLLTGHGKRAPKEIPDIEPDIAPAPKKPKAKRVAKRSAA